MFSKFLKDQSILKKFLFINLIIFIVIGSFTVIYINTVQPELIKKKTKATIEKVKETSKEEIEQIKEFQKQKNQEGKEQNKRNLEKLKSFFKIKKN